MHQMVNRGYYGQARWHRDYYEPYPMPYRRYPYYGRGQAPEHF
jgi:hypothetical protein